MTISRPSTSPLWKLLSVTCVAVLSMTILTTSSAAGGTDSTHPIYGGRHGDHLTTLCRGATIKSIEIAYDHEIRALRVGCAKTVGGEVNWQGWIGDKSTHRTWVMTCPNVRYGSKMYLAIVVLTQYTSPVAVGMISNQIRKI